jgi:hypothetical protein
MGTRSTHDPMQMQENESTLGHLGQLARTKVTDATHYVRERGLSGLRDDAIDVATRHPLSTVAVSLGVGYLLGRIMTRRS